MVAAGVGPGDNIITSPITFAASGNCALYLGAEVKFVDIRPDTYCLDPEKLEAAITKHAGEMGTPLHFVSRSDHFGAHHAAPKCRVMPPSIAICTNS